jgi:4-hydroxythreonine-4-phosphate dehydrogenase
MVHKPTIGLTMGDPAGVGPEVVLRALASEQIHELCRLVVFGDLAILQRCAEQIGAKLPPAVVIRPQQLGTIGASAQGPWIVDQRAVEMRDFRVAKVQAACGQASFDYIQAAIDAALAKQIDAVTTAPINKEALRAAGINFPGHTEMFAERAAAPRWCMMQYSPEITCSFVTVHCGYAAVPALLSRRAVLDVIELTAEALRRIRGKEPKLVVCGLNPHAGEHGLFGNQEEEQFIIPAINEALHQGIDVEGPLPPDTAFLPWKRSTTDAFVCMYHDQGHIPVKALAFDSAVNTTLGLDIIRTSVDHGTAFDIAWQGTARPDSLFAALKLAAQLYRTR